MPPVMEPNTMSSRSNVSSYPKCATPERPPRPWQRSSPPG
uniref:Uncharacterized protein n=1 Tax=Zea mays TaxID=4577 RepID=C0P3P2_MAIZE|nr:unknown [Zea mays]